MAVQLIKTGAYIALGHSFKAHPEKVLCDHCTETYELHYSAGEEHHLRDWLPKARIAVTKSHSNKHPDSVAIPQ